MRIALEFEKKGPAKYISHLDLQRAFSRTIRRSKLPVKMSRGFNPHYIVSFASALALGIESESECVEMETEDIPPQIFLKTIKEALPPGLYAKRAAVLPGNAPKLAAAVREAEYKAFFESNYMDEIKTAIYDIMESDELIVMKATKSGNKETDVRRMISDLKIKDGYLLMRLATAPAGSLKPGIVIDEIEKRSGRRPCSVVRTGLFAHTGVETVDLFEAYTEK